MSNWLPVGCALEARHDKNASVEGAFRGEREKKVIEKYPGSKSPRDGFSILMCR